MWATQPNRELCDSEKVARYYEWNLDELEFLDRLGFDGQFNPFSLPQGPMTSS